MALTQYQTDLAAIKAEANPQREIDLRAFERKIHEARTVSSSPTTYQATFNTIRGESGIQKEIDFFTQERAIATAFN